MSNVVKLGPTHTDDKKLWKVEWYTYQPYPLLDDMIDEGDTTVLITITEVMKI